MPHELDYILDAMSAVEKEDLRVSALLIHPEDVKSLESCKDFQKYTTSYPRPEWEGKLIGEIWNTKVISTNRIERGAPDAIPYPGGVRNIVFNLDLERSRPVTQAPTRCGVTRQIFNWTIRRITPRGSNG
jgi:hypothetical protein